MSASASMPERIGRFHIRSMLGRGAMGIVYLGHDEEIDRLVAIKLIRADLLDTEEREGYLKRFRNEAKIAGRCMHANIVGLYDFAMHDDNPYLVMEYIDGIGLQQFFPRGAKRSVDEVIHIALQVLDALHYAHGRSIVHRDIKPANILMMPDLSLKITDFGISRLTSMELTVTPLLIGTPSYMSPEQCLGSALDGRNDLFSLGCVLYELVAGERAFAGVNYTETIFAIVNKPHVPLSQLVPDLPPGFSEAIDKALAKSPEQRHPDAASFARLLDDIARDARLSRTGMPPVIIDSGRLSRRTGPIAKVGSAMGTLAGLMPGPSRAHAVAQATVEDVQPTISAPMTETGFQRPPEPTAPIHTAPAMPEPVIEPATTASDATGLPAAGPDEDLDATLKHALLPRAALLPAADPEPVPATAPLPEPPVMVDGTGHRPETLRRETSAVQAPGLAAEPTVPPQYDAPAVDPLPPVGDPTEAGSVSFTPGPHFALAMPLADAERARIIDCLASVLGPIAPLLARRAEQPGMSGAVLADILARHVRRDDERQLFHSLLEHGRPGPAAPAAASTSANARLVASGPAS